MTDIDDKIKKLQQTKARADAKIAKLQSRARSARTHRLCQFGGAFDAIISDDLLADLRLVPDAELAALRDRVATAIRQSADRGRQAAQGGANARP